MSDKYLESSTSREILEAQEESEEDNELTFTFFVKGEIVSWDKTLLYSYLKESHIAIGKNVKNTARNYFLTKRKWPRHGATVIETDYDASCCDEVAGFLKVWVIGLNQLRITRQDF